MRSLLSTITVTVATLVLAGPVRAQTAEEIVAKNIAAKGGEKLLRSTTSVRTTGAGVMQGQKVTIVTASKRPSQMRNEMTISQPDGAGDARPAQIIVQAFDGENLWIRMGALPPQVLPPGEQVEALKRTSQIDSPLLDYQAKGTSITLGEPTTENGRQLHHLIVTPKGAPVMHYYIDAATNLESRMTIEVSQEGKKVRMEMRFDDFRTIDGRTVPFAITQFVNGSQMGQLRFEKVEFNVPLGEDFFKLPKM
jgi:hypothetical protein